MNVLIITNVYTVSMYEKCRIAGIVKYIQVNKYILDLYHHISRREIVSFNLTTLVVCTCIKHDGHSVFTR